MLRRIAGWFRGASWDTAQLVEDFQLANRAANLAPSTIGQYDYVLGRFAREVRRFRGTPEEVEGFLAGLTGLSAQTKVNHWRCVGALVRWAHVRRGVPDAMAGVRRPKRPELLPRALDQETLRRALSAVADRRDRAMLMLLSDTGIRLGELTGLRRSDVREWLTVRGKSGARMVPVSPEVRQLLLGVGEGEVLWVARGGHHRGRPLTSGGVGQAIRAALARIDVVGGPHLLRHSFAVGYIRRGGDLRSLQLMMGHSQSGTTEVYLRFSNANLQELHRRYSPGPELLAASGRLL